MKSLIQSVLLFCLVGCTPVYDHERIAGTVHPESQCAKMIAKLADEFVGLGSKLKSIDKIASIDINNTKLLIFKINKIIPASLSDHGRSMLVIMDENTCDTLLCTDAIPLSAPVIVDSCQLKLMNSPTLDLADSRQLKMVSRYGYGPGSLTSFVAESAKDYLEDDDGMRVRDAIDWQVLGGCVVHCDTIGIGNINIVDNSWSCVVTCRVFSNKPDSDVRSRTIFCRVDGLIAQDVIAQKLLIIAQH